MHVFVSHSSKEADIAEKLCNALEREGNRCFIAPRDIRSGYEYAEEIANGIDGADVVLLVLSQAANHSPHVLREIERAVTKSVPIIVYKVEEVELTKSMEYFLLTHQWMESGRDSYADVVRCINDLEQKIQEKADSVSDKSSTVNNSHSSNKKNTKTGNTAKIVAGIVAAVLVAVAGIFCYIQMTEKNEKEVSGSAIETVKNQLRDVKLGDTITLGTYNDEIICWRVLNISEDGTEAVLVARDVLTVKAYDAPDSGCYNDDGTENYNFAPEKVEGNPQLQAYIRGNNSWENSNIRTWLNSASENVSYEGQAPTSSAMADGVNGYHTEKGFLCSFTEEELALIKTSDVETKGNALSDSDTVVTQDKIFLLSMEELAWFQEADVSLMAVPTAAAVANNKSTWYENYCIDYGVENIMWWLREPVEDSACMCYLVGNGYNEDNIYTWEVGVESFGIRPAMRIALK